jgi:hypothetical protein
MEHIFRNVDQFINLIYSFHDEELHILYRSHNLVRVICSRKLRLTGHLARKEKKKVEVLPKQVNLQKRSLGSQYF